jgi:tetratricopeptide (TPR) repeat protein
LLLVVAWTLLSPSAIAQEPAEPEAYRTAIDEAVVEFGARRFEEARALFARAHALLPNARTHRGLGMAEFELRNYGECIKHFEAALSSSVRPLDDALRADTEELLARTNNFVARFVLQATPAPSHVTVDGLALELNQQGKTVLVLLAGEHVIEMEAPGFAPVKRQLSAKGGEATTLHVLFNRPAQTAAAAAPRDEPKAERRWYKSPWLWTAVGVVAAGAITGTVLALKRDDGPPDSYGGSANVVLHSLSTR